VTVSAAELATLRAAPRRGTITRRKPARRPNRKRPTDCGPRRPGDSKKVFDELTETHNRKRGGAVHQGQRSAVEALQSLASSTLAKATAGVVWASATAGVDAMAKLESKLRFV